MMALGIRGGIGMDPVSLIVLALAAGASAGLKDTVSQAVQDAYGGLRALALRRLAGRQDGALILDRHEESPQVWALPLTGELTAAGAGRDGEMLRAAQALMSLLDQAGSRNGRYQVDLRGAQGVQVGDGNVQSNQFGGPAVSAADGGIGFGGCNHGIISTGDHAGNEIR